MSDELITIPRERLDALLRAAEELGSMLLKAELFEGGLIGPRELQSANRLRLELSRWAKTK
jgi:hypothetical protein